MTPSRPHVARGLCGPCYTRWHKAVLALAASVAAVRALARGRP